MGDRMADRTRSATGARTRTLTQTDKTYAKKSEGGPPKNDNENQRVQGKRKSEAAACGQSLERSAGTACGRRKNIASVAATEAADTPGNTPTRGGQRGRTGSVAACKLAVTQKASRNDMTRPSEAAAKTPFTPRNTPSRGGRRASVAAPKQTVAREPSKNEKGASARKSTMQNRQSNASRRLRTGASRRRSLSRYSSESDSGSFTDSLNYSGSTSCSCSDCAFEAYTPEKRRPSPKKQLRIV